MIRQDVKLIASGNIIAATEWAANDIEKRGMGYKIGEPYEFPKTTMQEPVVEEVDE